MVQGGLGVESYFAGIKSLVLPSRISPFLVIGLCVHKVLAFCKVLLHSLDSESAFLLSVSPETF